jgi:hypothetical protein
MTRRVSPRFRQRHISSETLWNLPVPDVGGADLGEWLLVVVGIVAVILILIPLLFFGVELIVVGALLAAGLVSRVVLRRPWVVVAQSSDAVASGRRLEWQVQGWRRSGELIEQIASDLSAGREPDQ